MAELPSYYQNAADRHWLNAALTVSQLGAAGFTILLRASHVQALSRFVFPFYQNCIGFLLLAPLAYFVEKDQRPDLRFSTICRLFILGSIGVVINQVTYVTSSSFISSSFTSVMDIVTPLVTFILAGACWLEEVHFRRRDGQAKVLGIFVSCFGAIVMSLRKGPPLMKTMLGQSDASSFIQMESATEAWQLGSISLIGSLSLAVYLILQVPILTRYPAPLSVAAFSCLFGALELAILSAIFEHEPSKWILQSAPQIYSVFYAGVIGTALVYGTQSWGIFRGGPVIVAVYQPLKMVFLCILGAVLLKQALHLGSLIGAALVVFGIYVVLWGREEQRRMAVMASLTDPLWSAA